jgi:hypothetical protein
MRRPAFIFMLLVVCLLSGEAKAALGGEALAALSAQKSAAGWDMSAQSLVRLQYRTGAYPWRLYVDGAAGLDRLAGQYSWEAKAELERCYVKVSLPAFDLNVGRQQISWGLGYAWAPTDLFSPPDPRDPARPRPGVDAVVVRIPVGPLAYWSAVAAYKPHNPLARPTAWQLAVRRHGNLNGKAWSVLAVRDGAATVLGGDVKIDYGPSWAAEAAYYRYDDQRNRWEGAVGADYSWFDGQLIWRGEYLYNSAGAARQEEYDYQALQQGHIKYPARHYLFQQLTWQVDLFSTLNAAVLANLVDGSALWTLTGQTHLSDSLGLAASLAAPVGQAGAEYALPAKLIARLQIQYTF